MWSWLIQFSQAALVVFLFSLVRKPAEGSKAFGSVSLLSTTAMVATIAGAIAVIANLVFQFVAASEFSKRQAEVLFFGGPTRLQFILMNAVHGVPEWCRAVVPLVVYKSLTVGSPDPIR